jgi:membrane-associated phospholipid phosphatase
MSYFMTLLTANPSSHGATYRLLNVANLVGLFLVQHFKEKFKWPRPSQICPALLPPIAVPGHASYPSGHATQAHLMAFCLKEVIGPANKPVVGPTIEALADRITKNRELAGVHYPMDGIAGKALAEAAFNLLMAMPGENGGKSKFAAAIEAAQKECA